jgi:integrase
VALEGSPASPRRRSLPGKCLGTRESFLAQKAESGRLDDTGGLVSASVRRLYVTLRKSLDNAVRKGLLSVNPVDLADKPRVRTRDVTENVWTPDQVSAFLDATGTDRLAPLWHLPCMAGLRRSELAGLRWGDLDLETGALSVKRPRRSSTECQP